MVPRPILVEATLAGPMVDRADPIHLDGLLALAWAIRHPHFACPSRTDRIDDFQSPHIPLARLVYGDDWVWLSSAAMPIGHDAPAVVWQTARRDPDDWDRLAAPVNVHAGPQKDVLIRRQARLVTGLRWLGWGCVRETRKSLRLLWGHENSPNGSVGSARRSGSGQISAWSCVAGDHTPEDVVAFDGILRRHVPVAWLEQAETIRKGACLPPYWHPGLQVVTAAVGSAARLTLGARKALLDLKDAD